MCICYGYFDESRKWTYGLMKQLCMYNPEKYVQIVGFNPLRPVQTVVESLNIACRPDSHAHTVLISFSIVAFEAAVASSLASL
jgi:hypothetical protein